MKTIQRILYLVGILAVILLALGLRLRAVEKLPIDYDEDDYLGAAQHYAAAIRRGDWAEIRDYAYNYEHPPLTKVVYALAILPLPEVEQLLERPSTEPPASTLPQPHLQTARTVSAVLGTLESGALALVDPLAGLFLAVYTWQIKYTSQIMLEPLPALTSLLMVLFYARWRKGLPRINGWLVASAVAFGLTVASKYVYGIAGIAILADWALAYRQQRASLKLERAPGWSKIRPLVVWGLLAVLIFFAANPHLWADPIHRLSQSVLFHGDYAQSAHVKSAGFPPWQPLIWLVTPVPWHPGVFLVAVDALVALLALVGWKRTWERQRVFGLWFALALGFLLVWPTKWPQYILILTAPLSILAGQGFRIAIVEPLARWITVLRQTSVRRPVLRLDRLAWREARRAAPWLVPGLLAMTALTLFPMLFQGAMALTDFNRISIRDGITGGVWREVWRGLTFQVEPLEVGLSVSPYQGVFLEVRDRGEAVPVAYGGLPVAGNEVHFIGFYLISSLLSGGIGDLMVFTVLWTVLSVSMQTALGVLLAVMLNRTGVRLRRFWLGLFILPWAIPEFIGALIWTYFFEPTNGFLSLLLDTKIPWNQSPFAALGVMLAAATWMGFPFMLFAATAGLKLIPGEAHDAAAVDGASSWQLFRYITWPLILPLLAPALLVRSIFAFNQFYLFYVMDPPFINLATLSFYLFSTQTRSGGQFAISAALNLVTALALFLGVLWLDRWNRGTQGVTYV